MNDPTSVIYPKPWRALESEGEREGLQRRYELEITAAHPLWNEGGKVIGRSNANDDVVVHLADGRFAIVHLVWGTSPGGERWPAAYIFQTASGISAAIHEWSKANGFFDE